MKYRIALWATAGLLVAGGWELYVLGMSPFANEHMQEVWSFVAVTCPVMVVRAHIPMTWYGALLANAATYAVIGLIVEAIRKPRAVNIS